MNIDRTDPTPDGPRKTPDPVPFRERHEGKLLAAAGTLFLVVVLLAIYRHGEAKDQDQRDLADHFAAKYDVDVIGYRLEDRLTGDSTLVPVGSGGAVSVPGDETVQVWVVDGEDRDCVVAGEDTDDPSLICDGAELPRG